LGAQLVKTSLAYDLVFSCRFVYFFASYHRPRMEGNAPSEVTLTIVCGFDLFVFGCILISIAQILFVVWERRTVIGIYEAKPTEREEMGGDNAQL
jgi:hypothetical protein